MTKEQLEKYKQSLIDNRNNLIEQLKIKQQQYDELVSQINQISEDTFPQHQELATIDKELEQIEIVEEMIQKLEQN